MSNYLNLHWRRKISIRAVNYTTSTWSAFKSIYKKLGHKDKLKNKRPRKDEDGQVDKQSFLLPTHWVAGHVRERPRSLAPTCVYSLSISLGWRQSCSEKQKGEQKSEHIQPEAQYEKAFHELYRKWLLKELQGKPWRRDLLPRGGPTFFIGHFHFTIYHFLCIRARWMQILNAIGWQTNKPTDRPTNRWINWAIAVEIMSPKFGWLCKMMNIKCAKI